MPKLKVVFNGRMAFHCPGCRRVHVVIVSGPDAWGFNGNMDAPSFTPSYKAIWTETIGNAIEAKCCHSTVTDGVIEFGADSTHDLAGQKVPLPEWD